MERRTFLRATAAALATLGCSASNSREHEEGDGEVSTSDELASLAKATAWINSPALTAASVRGRVVLVQFCTFTCVNWLRTLPYARAWAEKYRDAGLIVIGAHTPEFSFEHDLANVQRALRDMRVTYPIAVDNESAIWRGFGNQYWPALYLVDSAGRVRHRQFGEGGYVESERMIQKVLTEAGARLPDRELVSVDARGIEAAADWADVKSPETYLGYEKAETFASPDATPDRPHVYRAPRALSLNQWSLEGDWTIGREFVTSNQQNGRLAFSFHSRDLNVIMGPPGNARAAPFRVLVDGQAPGASHGTDVDERGEGIAREQRVYQLIRQPRPIVDRVFEIVFPEPGVEVFNFTFG